jgi:DNA-binding transcriptional LysR family regulator
MGPFKNEFEYFLILAETPNLSHASEIIGIQQAALSKSLKKLEVSLRTQLFIRKSNGLQITELGSELFINLTKTKNVWLQQHKESEKLLTEIKGHLKLGAHKSVALSALGKTYPKITSEFPKLKIDLHFDSSSVISKQVINAELDIGIVVNPPQHNDLIIKKLQVEFVASWSTSTNPERTLYYNPEMVSVQKILKKKSDHNHVPVADYDVLTEFLLNSKAIGLLPNTFAQKHKSLKQIGPKVITAQLCLIYRVDRPKTPAFKKVISILSQKKPH